MIPAQELVERGLRDADTAGADGCIVLVEERSHADVRFAQNATTTNGVHRARTVSVVTMAGTGAGIGVGTGRRSGVVGLAGMDDIVAASLADARRAPPAEDAAPLVQPAPAPAGDPFDVAPRETGAAVLEPVLSFLSPAFARARSRDVVLAGFAEHDVTTTYLGTSTGVRLAHVQPTGSVHLVARDPDGARSAWVGAPSVTPDFEHLEDHLATRLNWARRRIALDPGRYEVILPPSAVADMMATLAFSGLGGQDAEDGRTVFSRRDGGTRLGESISALPFTLWSDPAEPGLECAPFVATDASGSDTSVFDNGLALGRIDWIRQGLLTHLRYHRAGAARSGVTPAPYVDNLLLACAGSPPDQRADPQNATLDEMAACTDRGLLLTCLWYIREVDPSTLLVTGLTRDGVYVVEDGAVVGAANNFRFNESPVDLLSRATEVGRPERTLAREHGEYLNRTVMPTLRIPDFNMSSVSASS